MCGIRKRNGENLVTESYRTLMKLMVLGSPLVVYMGEGVEF